MRNASGEPPSGTAEWCRFPWSVAVSEPEIVETWSTVEYPILRAIVRAQQTGEGRIWAAPGQALPELDNQRLKTALFWPYPVRPRSCTTLEIAQALVSA
jgi:hypothetical protein